MVSFGEPASALVTVLRDHPLDCPNPYRMSASRRVTRMCSRCFIRVLVRYGLDRANDDNIVLYA